MVKNIVIIIISLLALVLKGNCDSTNTSKLLKISPVELLNNIFHDSGTIQLSYETSINNKYSINQDIGYVFHYNEKSIISIKLDELYGYSFETELRRYFLNHKKNSGIYTGIGIYYKYLEAKDRYYMNDEKYTIYRHETATHAKIGCQHINQNGFTYDYSIGLGWRRISSRNNSKYPIESKHSELPYDKSFYEGSKHYLSLTLAIRIGWEL